MPKMLWSVSTQMKSVSGPALRVTDPDIHQEFIDGNFGVNKNQIPFCAIGVDHALEHIDRIMKVTGGLVLVLVG